MTVRVPVAAAEPVIALRDGEPVDARLALCVRLGIIVELGHAVADCERVPDSVAHDDARALALAKLNDARCVPSIE